MGLPTWRDGNDPNGYPIHALVQPRFFQSQSNRQVSLAFHYELSNIDTIHGCRLHPLR